MANGTNGNGRRPHRARWIIVAGIIVVVLVLAAFMSLRRSDVQVVAERPVREEIVSTISTNGKVEPQQNFAAYAPSPTTVQQIFVKEGDHVKAGQPLLKLEDSAARAQLAKSLAQLKAAQADLASAQSGGTRDEVVTRKADLVKAQTENAAAQQNLEALKRLQQKGAASEAEVTAAENRARTAQAQVDALQQKQTSRYSQPELQKIEAQVADARAAYKAAQDMMADANLRAPRAGTVFSLPVRQGQFVNTGDLLVQVADLKQLNVRAYVDEPEIGRLTKGQEVDVTWDALPGRVWKGTVATTPTTVVNHGTRVVGEITCTVDNSDLKLLPNVNVNVTVITARDQNAVTVPRGAIHEENGKNFVYEVVGDSLKRREVKVGISNLTRTEVLQGLDTNAMVALGAENGAQALREGMHVRVVQE